MSDAGDSSASELVDDEDAPYDDHEQDIEHTDGDDDGNAIARSHTLPATTQSGKHHSKPKKIQKAKSKHDAHSSYNRDDEDERDVQSIDGDDNDDDLQDMLDETINEDSNSHNGGYLGTPTKPEKRSSTLDMVKNGLFNAKKRLNMNNNNNSNNGNGHQSSSPTTPDMAMAMVSAQYTPSQSDSNANFDHDGIDTPPHSSSSSNKKQSLSTSLFGGLSKGKNLFARNGDDVVGHSGGDDDQKQMAPKAARVSKSNLGGIKAKLQNMTKSYSNKNVSPPADDQNDQMESKAKKRSKADKKRKESKSTAAAVASSSSSSSAKKKDKKSKSSKKKKEPPTAENVSSSSTKRSNKLKQPDNMARKRSASQNKTADAHHMQVDDESDDHDDDHGYGNVLQPTAHDAAHLKRHSMQPLRSRSQKPHGTQHKENGAKASHRQTVTADQSRLDDIKAKVVRKSTSNVADERLKMSKAHSEFAQAKHGAIKDRSDPLGKKKKPKKASATHKPNLSAANTVGGALLNDDAKRAEKPKERELDDKMMAADKKCKYRIRDEVFELYGYYKPIRLIGSGAYAIVCEAIDERTKKRVAIKKNKGVFADIRDARRILRETKLLLHYNKYRHPDLIEIYDAIPPSVSEIQSFKDVYLVMPLLESNLCKIITSNQKLSNLHYQYITYQILRGLKFIHESGVIHRDIKPENILLNGKDCDIKIIDFGLARGVLGTDGEDNPESGAKATEYVCTRWYRSPEVMCSGGRYDEKMDIWGVGCILAEMVLRRPLFPGANYLDQLNQIFAVMGSPTDVNWIHNEQALQWVLKQPKEKGKNLKKMMRHKFDNEQDLVNCADLLARMLALSPKDRISATEAVQHPYFKELHDEDEVLSGDKFDLSFEFEQSIKTKFGVRHMMYTSLDGYHKRSWHRIKKKLKKKAAQQKAEEAAAANEEKPGRSSSSSKQKHKSSSKKHSDKHKHKEKKSSSKKRRDDHDEPEEHML